MKKKEKKLYEYQKTKAQKSGWDKMTKREKVYNTMVKSGDICLGLLFALSIGIFLVFLGGPGISNKNK
tara:strand:- start:90 stop:293 length:204 start_codon:yes stop_codon:yes gene_type:complete